MLGRRKGRGVGVLSAFGGERAPAASEASVGNRRGGSQAFFFSRRARSWAAVRSRSAPIEEILVVAAKRRAERERGGPTAACERTQQCVFSEERPKKGLRIGDTRACPAPAVPFGELFGESFLASERL